MSEVTEKQLEDIEALFVQTAGSLSSEGNVITMHGLSPSTIYFADRPQREVGHMSTRRFVDLWGEGDNSFEVDPPNAVLTFAEKKIPSTAAASGACSAINWRRPLAMASSLRSNPHLVLVRITPAATIE